jgi:hypothetical protein
MQKCMHLIHIKKKFGWFAFMVLKMHPESVKKRRFHMKLKANLLVATATVVALSLVNFTVSDLSVQYSQVEAAKGGNGGGNSAGGSSGNGGGNGAGGSSGNAGGNSAANASDRAKERAASHSAVGVAAAAEREAAYQEALAEELAKERLRLQENGSIVNFNIETETKATTTEATSAQ